MKWAKETDLEILIKLTKDLADKVLGLDARIRELEARQVSE